MKTVSDLLKNVPIPKVLRVRQHFDRTCVPVEDIPSLVRRELLHVCREAVQPGMRIAVTCGSRGIRNYALMVHTIVAELKALGTEPFIVGAMGSHGGATEAGQRQILADYGISEAAMGCPVLCQMDTVEVGKSIWRGNPVRIDKNAAKADGILLFNRVKPHTSFRGTYESGLMKMMAIGLGKQHGADDIHGQSPSIMHELVEEYGRTILESCPVLGGLAVVENAYDDTLQITGLRPAEILTEEPKLKALSYETIAQLPFDACDVLVVDRIGKNISGDGMDPNVSGRFCTPYASGGIAAEKVVVLDLTDQTHGNAQGIGLADVTTQRLVRKMTLEMTYPTGVTNTFLHLMKIPMLMDNDREAIQLALRSCPDADDKANMKLIRIPDTAHIEYLEISEGLLPQAKANPRLEIVSEPYALPFDAEGNLL